MLRLIQILARLVPTSRFLHRLLFLLASCSLFTAQLVLHTLPTSDTLVFVLLMRTKPGVWPLRSLFPAHCIACHTLVEGRETLDKLRLMNAAHGVQSLTSLAKTWTPCSSSKHLPQGLFCYAYEQSSLVIVNRMPARACHMRHKRGNRVGRHTRPRADYPTINYGEAPGRGSRPERADPTI
jgi:hypothetical protein